MENKSIAQGISFTSPFNFLGGVVIGWVNELGALVIFFVRGFLLIFKPKQLPLIIQQVFFIGAKSANIVMLVGLFTGMVIGLQMYYVTAKC